MSNHPLDETFGVHGERLIDDEANPIEIPEEKELRDLDLIIDFALRAYKEQMEDVRFIEPKNRVRYLEVAERFLHQAKDAMAKRDKLLLDRERLEKGAKTTQKTPEKDDKPEGEPEGGISRADLQRRMRAVK